MAIGPANRPFGFSTTGNSVPKGTRVFNSSRGGVPPSLITTCVPKLCRKPCASRGNSSHLEKSSTKGDMASILSALMTHICR
jgi:hypothetical protein